MNKNHAYVKKIALCGMLAAIGVIGGSFSVPVGFTRCCPTQSIINVLGAIFVGPWYNLAVAFVIASIRNIMGTGSIMAFPGSMCGALIAGLLYKMKPALPMACLGEIVGTGIISAIMAYPIAIYLLGREAALFTYVVPFMTAAITGVVLAAVLVFILDKTGAMKILKKEAE